MGVLKKEPEWLDLKASPGRMASMMYDELLSSYREGAKEELLSRLKTFPAEGSREMLTMGPISLVSLCAHHGLPFFGEAWVGYIPNEKIIGLSKIPRIVNFFSRKFQVQERLVTEIADFVDAYLEPTGVIVLIRAVHMCMEARGVGARGVKTVTSAIRGAAESPSVKSEFYRLIGMG